MRVFGFDIKRQKPSSFQPVHTLSDEEREMGLEVRHMRQAEKRVMHEIELLKLENAKLELQVQKAELEAELGLDESDGFDLESLFSNFMKNAATRMQQGQNPQPPDALAASPLRSYSDDELRVLKTKIPSPILHSLKSKTDDELVALARERYPDVFNSIDEDTKRRALVILKQ